MCSPFVDDYICLDWKLAMCVVKGSKLKLYWGFWWFDYIYSKGGVEMIHESTGKLKMVPFKEFKDMDFCRCETTIHANLKVQVWRLRKCGSLCAEWALCQLLVFHVGWGVGAAQASLTEGFPSWWVLRRTRCPKSLSSLFMETMKQRPLLYHDLVNWQSRL